MISPYTLTYDSLLLTVPLAWLVQERRQPYVFAAIWLCLLPVGLFDGIYGGPNTLPIACALCLWAMHAGPRLSKTTATGPLPAAG
jgi:hypothetical protein